MGESLVIYKKSLKLPFRVIQSPAMSHHKSVDQRSNWHLKESNYITICLCSRCKLESQIRHFPCSDISDWKMQRGDQKRKRMPAPTKAVCQLLTLKHLIPLGHTHSGEPDYWHASWPTQRKETFPRFCFKTPNLNTGMHISFQICALYFF